MKKSLIIGLDLSFSSTGITVSYLEDKVGKKIQFYRVVFDENKNKKKIYTPDPISNVNQITYKLPTNILAQDLIIDCDDENNSEQVEATLKALICCKKINHIIQEVVKQFAPDEMIFVLENYIMPSYTGPQQLKTVSGLIMLQGYVRGEIIKIRLLSEIPTKIMTPTPSNLKKFFTKDGTADKLKMMKFFIEHYEGQKLIPDVCIEKIGVLNDIIDSFALCMKGYNEYIKVQKFAPNIL